MSKKNILVVGELNIDIILDNIRGFPVIGHEILADNMNVTLGSSSAIFACNIATLGLATSFCGMLGNDVFGNFILDELKKKSVDTKYITVSNELKTGATLVLNYSEDRANVTHCGTMEVFNKSNIPLEKLAQYSHLHFSSYFLQKGIQADITELFKTAKNKGLTTSLDLQWDPDNKWDFPYKDCLPHVDYFLPNESELLLLSGENELDRALEKIGEYGNIIIVKRGSKGAVAYEKGKFIYAQPFLHQHFADAIGAGDSFNAGFIAKYLEGCSLEDSLKFANLAGAINTTASGGTTAFSSLETFRNKAKELFNIVL